MKKRNHVFRYIALCIVFVSICAIYLTRLVNYQISGVDLYAASNANTVTRTETIQAHRGEIYDRNGKILISNKYTYNFYLDYSRVPKKNADKNELFLKIEDVLKKSDNTDKKVEIFSPFAGEYPNFTYNAEFFENASAQKKFNRILGSNKLDEDISCEKLQNFFAKQYGLVDKKGEPLYTNEEISYLIKFRYNLDYKNFSSNEPYVIAKDIDINLISLAKETRLSAVYFPQKVERVYEYPGYASHILGRTGAIQSADVEHYTELGYPLDAIVGNSGVEKAFEQYLHGTDGEKTIVEDENGNIIEEYISKEPIAGKDIYLTIDIDLQIKAEDALAENIKYIAGKAKPNSLTGEDADAGAVTVMAPKTGEVLAIGSYPTYNLATFSEDWAALNEDVKHPMMNRALFGVYPPGSTFKIATAIAALTEKVIDPNTMIETKGRYTFYSPDGPRCWIYLEYGQTHGIINVTTAIQESCNYFFFEMGQRLGIERLNKYCSELGLGEYTGIELEEWKGILAGPEYRENNGLDLWNPGDTLAAAIGQSENAFSPLQLSTYISTVVNQGTRYKTHLLYKVKNYATGEVEYEYTPEVVSKIDISDGIYYTIMNAMKSVTENGSASRLFTNYPITVGGKTGTAQISDKKSDNAVFVAFAPFDNPEIVASCVIEQGASGTDAGITVRDVFTKYFNLDSETK